MTKMVRSLAVIAAVLVVLCGLYAYRRVATGESPFASAVKKSARIVLSADTRQTEFTKEKDQWSVHTSSGLQPANMSRLEVLFETLRSVRLESIVSESKEYEMRFEVNTGSATHVSLMTRDGRPLASGLIGKQSPDFAHFYFRRPDHPTIYLATGLTRGDVNPGNPADWVAVARSTATAK